MSRINALKRGNKQGYGRDGGESEGDSGGLIVCGRSERFKEKLGHNFSNPAMNLHGELIVILFGASNEFTYVFLNGCN